MLNSQYRPLFTYLLRIHSERLHACNLAPAPDYPTTGTTGSGTNFFADKLGCRADDSEGISEAASAVLLLAAVVGIVQVNDVGCSPGGCDQQCVHRAGWSGYLRHTPRCCGECAQICHGVRGCKLDNHIQQPVHNSPSVHIIVADVVVAAHKHSKRNSSVIELDKSVVPRRHWSWLVVVSTAWHGGASPKAPRCGQMRGRIW